MRGIDIFKRGGDIYTFRAIAYLGENRFYSLGENEFFQRRAGFVFDEDFRGQADALTLENKSTFEQEFRAGIDGDADYFHFSFYRIVRIEFVFNGIASVYIFKVGIAYLIDVFWRLC